MENPSYHRKTPIVVTEKMRRQIAGAVAEIDLAQMAILKSMTPAQRMQRMGLMIDSLEQSAAYRLRQRRPELSIAESLRIVRSGLLEYELRRQG